MYITNRNNAEEKMCDNCSKMKKRSDFPKEEWSKKNEDGGIDRKCGSCSKTQKPADSKLCSKCGETKERVFFTKAEYRKAGKDLEHCLCNDCNVNKVAAVVEEKVVKEKKEKK
jgi:hypothetical protein